MQDIAPLKSEFCTLLKQKIQEKILGLTLEREALLQARNSEEKNSAGDKYETAREMAQIELNKLEMQLSLWNNFALDCGRLAQVKATTMVQNGSLVETNKGWFFIGLAIGKIQFRNMDVYALSTAAPMGKALLGKKQGELVSFNGQEIELKQVI